MTEQDFYEAGAECVGGDLILNRVVVGRYRHGQFVLSEEGLLLSTPPAVPVTVEPDAPKQAITRKPKAAKVDMAEKLAKLDQDPAPVPAADPVASTTLDELLTGN